MRPQKYWLSHGQDNRHKWVVVFVFVVDVVVDVVIVLLFSGTVIIVHVGILEQYVR